MSTVTLTLNIEVPQLVGQWFSAFGQVALKIGSQIHVGLTET